MGIDYARRHCGSDKTGADQMSLRDDYFDRSEYEGHLCPCCHCRPSDTVDREDGHHYMRCSCGKVRIEYDDEAFEVNTDDTYEGFSDCDTQGCE